ncbi:hypothetical protein HanRHA438_Chr08g0348911 [Helianthus annuus]|nr:hypothetical protein HanIR_Chr08g0364761 [Helianthus annuus]KAJ0897730.1 hypothetical protein HanRHA438_Chr08g0348911 [Helianthus annuus]
MKKQDNGGARNGNCCNCVYTNKKGTIKSSLIMLNRLVITRTIVQYPRMPFPIWRSIFAPTRVYDQGESSSNEQHMDPYATRPLARGVMESFFGPHRGPN